MSLQLLTSLMIYLVTQLVVLIGFMTNHLYFSPNCNKLSVMICYIQKMPFGKGLSLPS